MPSNQVEASSNSAFTTPESKKTPKRKVPEVDQEDKRRSEQDDKRMKILQNKSALEELSQAMKSEKINLDMLVNQLASVKKQIQEMILDIELTDSEISVLEKRFAMNLSQVKLVGGIKDQLKMLETQEKCLKVKLTQLKEYRAMFDK